MLHAAWWRSASLLASSRTFLACSWRCRICSAIVISRLPALALTNSSAWNSEDVNRLVICLSKCIKIALHCIYLLVSIHRCKICFVYYRQKPQDLVSEKIMSHPTLKVGNNMLLLFQREVPMITLARNIHKEEEMSIHFTLFIFILESLQ